MPAVSRLDPYVPLQAEVVDRLRESETIFTLRLRVSDAAARRAYRFEPGQFRAWFDSGWDIEAWDERPAGLSCRAVKR